MTTTAHALTPLKCSPRVDKAFSSYELECAFKALRTTVRFGNVDAATIAVPSNVLTRLLAAASAAGYKA